MNNLSIKKAVLRIIFVIVITVGIVIVSEFLGIPASNPLMVAYFLIFLYYSLDYFVRKREHLKFIEQNMVIAKKQVLDQKYLAVLIVNNDKVAWANDYAYEEIPQLLKTRNFREIIPEIKNETAKINNKIYSVKKEEEIYFLYDVTEQQRELSKLKSRQIVIGFLRIDNYDFLEQSLSKDEFFMFEKEIKYQLVEKLDSEKIYNQEIADDRFSLNIPYSHLLDLIDNRFPFIQEIIDTMSEKGFDVTLSVGIAYNYDDVVTIGQKAQNALDLAVSRGGAQIVLFNDEEKKYIGGKITASRSNIKLRARIVFNTIAAMTKDYDTIYFTTHRNPDYDAIASMFMLSQLLKRTNDDEAKVHKTILDSNVDKEIIKELETVEGIKVEYNTVVDKTKKNILIITDTQAADFISHPNFLKEIDDIIVIDHHQTPENYIGNSLFSWIEPSCSSTAEMITSMLIAQDLKLEQKTLMNLALKGILTDTNQFHYRTESNTFEIAAALLNMGATMITALEALYPTYHQYDEILKILVNKKVYDGKKIICEVDEEKDSILLAIAASNLIDIKGIEIALTIAKLPENGNFLCKIRTKEMYNSKKIVEEFGGAGHARQGSVVLTKSQKNKLIEKIIEEY